MIRELFTPELQSDPHHWAATFLAHIYIGIGLWACAGMLWSAWDAIWYVTAIYFVAWEGAQLVYSRRLKVRFAPMAWDAVLDTVAICLGCYAAYALSRDMWVHAASAWGASMIIAAIGWNKRAA